MGINEGFIGETEISSASVITKIMESDFSADTALETLANYTTEIVDTTEEIPTHFSQLDKVLDGGLYDGLYIIGAMSSIGKTSFVLQIADQIAQKNEETPVIIFSLEMSKAEMIAKSLSRHTYDKALKKGDYRKAKTARGIMNGTWWPRYTKEEMAIISESMEEYRKYAHHIYIREGNMDTDIIKIRQYVAEFTKKTETRPVVIVDYLQIMPAPFIEGVNRTYTDKQIADINITELKRISREFRIPVIAISSFNRNSYGESGSMAAFKESGSIEYSADVLLALQLEGVGAKDFDIDAAKKKDPRDVELVILKNRQGRTGDKLKYTYYPGFNSFREKRNIDGLMIPNGRYAK